MVADDTDIFIILLHFCCQGDISASTSVLMVSPIRSRAVIDINATVDLHRDIIPYLLAAHGLTGCDTVATYFGIGKAAALRVLTSGVHAITHVGDTCHWPGHTIHSCMPWTDEMYIIDRGTSENVGKQSGPECGWCTKTGSSASNK